MEEVWNYYEHIRGALNGIYEILTMKFEEDDIMHRFALDKLEELKDKIIEFIEQRYNSAEI